MERLKILVTIPSTEVNGISVKERFFTDRVISRLNEIGDVTYNELGRGYTKEELRDALEGIDVVFAGWGTLKYDDYILSKADKLKVIAYAAGSVQPIVTDAIYDKNILLLSGNPVFAESVAEATLCYAMCSLRDIKYFTMTPKHPWREDDEDSKKGIMDRSIGIIGFGMVAKYFLKMLEPFHVTKKIYSEYVTEEDASKYGATVATLDEIFETCDIVSVHAGLNEKTYHMIKEEHLNKMAEGALLINTARGEIIDEQALIKILKTGRINAALDVYEVEPPPADSPLLTLPNVLCLPHIGGPTIDRCEYVTLKLIDDLKLWMNGETNLECKIEKKYAENMTHNGYRPNN